MRILYHHRTQGEEPESIHIDAIVGALKELGHEVFIVGPTRGISTSGGARPTLLARVKRVLPGVGFELLQMAYNAASFLKLRRAAARIRPDLIYERYALYHWAGVLFARWRGLPLILEVNTPYAHAWAQYYKLRLKRLALWSERFTLRRAGAIITVSEAERRFLVEHGTPAEKITVCHNAIDPRVFDPASYPHARRDLGLGDDGLVVGFVGTMNRWQGIGALRDAMETVLRSRPDVSFLLVGDGEGRPELEALCRRLGAFDRVVFAGRRGHAEVPRLVAAMDVAVLASSNSYGSPMKLFEYLAMSKAVVAPRVGPVEEILEDGRNGLLIEPGSARELAEAILRLAADGDLRRCMGEEGRRRVLAQHTWRKNAETVVAVCRGLEAGPGHPAAPRVGGST